MRVRQEMPEKAGRQLTILRVNDTAGVDSIAEKWDELAADLGFPLLASAWTKSAAAAFHADDELCILAAHRDGKLVGLAPMAQVRFGLGYRLELIGVRDLGEPSGLLYQDQEACAGLCRAILEVGLPILMARTEVSGALQLVMANCVRGRGMLLWRPSAGSPRAVLTDGYAGYLARRSSQRRADLRRAERRLEQWGDARFHVSTTQPDMLPAKLERFLNLEAAGWKGRNGSAVHSRPPLQRFFEVYCLEAARRGHLRICTLEVASTVIAMQIALEYGKRFWVLKIAFDEAFARASPGVVLAARALEHCAKQELQSYEFLGTEEHWLEPWSDGMRECAAVLVIPYTYAGLLGLLGEGLAWIRRRLNRKVAPSGAAS